MEFSKPGAYIKQIAIYLHNGDKGQSFDTAKAFVAKFPDEPMGHLLLAMASIMNGDFTSAKLEAHKAFNLVTSPEDLMSCAIIAAMAHFELKEYTQGYQILTAAGEKASSPELEEMLVIFGILSDNPAIAAKHYSALSKMNSKLAIELFDRIAGKV